MNISKLIEQLQKIRAEVGDLRVIAGGDHNMVVRAEGAFTTYIDGDDETYYLETIHEDDVGGYSNPVRVVVVE